MEGLLGNLHVLLATVNQISLRGVEMPQPNAALMSALEGVEWIVLRPRFLKLKWLKNKNIYDVPVFCLRRVKMDSN